MAKKNRRQARLNRREAREERAVAFGLSSPSLRQPPKKQKKHAKERREEAKAKRQQDIARARFERQMRALNPPKASQPTSTLSIDEQIERTLAFIKENENTNVNQELSNKITEAIALETGNWDVDFVNEPETDLYKVDETWDGNPNSIISHIELKKDLQNPEAVGALEDIVESDWGSPEKYEEHLEKASAQAYDKNVKAVQDTLNKVPKQMLGVLEDIMNSSTMWHIVGDRYGLSKGDPRHYESESAKEDWDSLHKDVQKLVSIPYGVSQADMDKLINAISKYDAAGNLSKAPDDAYANLKNIIEEILSKY